MESHVIERFKAKSRRALCVAEPDPLDSALQVLESVVEGDADALGHCQAHAGVAVCWLERADVVQAEWHLQQALRWARLHGEPDIELDTLCAMAGTAFKVAQYHERAGDHGQARMALNRTRDACFEGVQVVTKLREVHLQATMLTRLAEVLHDCGDQDDAQALRERARQLRVQIAN